MSRESQESVTTGRVRQLEFKTSPLLSAEERRRRFPKQTPRREPTKAEVAGRLLIDSAPILGFFVPVILIVALAMVGILTYRTAAIMGCLSSVLSVILIAVRFNLM